MKKSAALVSLMLACQGQLAFAGDDTATIQYRGQAEQKQFRLQDEEGHTVYETRTVADTCYREVLDHYETRCHDVARQECTPITRMECRDVSEQICSPSRTECTPITRMECTGTPPNRTCHPVQDQVCRTVPGDCRTVTRRECSPVYDQVCRTVYDRVCNDYPIYRNEPYTCYKTIQVPVGYEVDYTVDADVTVSLGRAPQDVQADETLKLMLNGSKLSLKGEKLSNRLLVLVDKNVKEEVVAPKQKRVTGSYALQFRSIEQILAPTKGEISDFVLTESELSFTTAKVGAPEFFALNLYIGRQQFLVGDLKKFDGDVAQEAFALEDQGDRTLVRVDLKKLKADVFKGAKYNVRVKVRAEDTRNRTFLNPGLLPESAQKELKKTLKAEK
jgi:hypothetical protein